MPPSPEPIGTVGIDAEEYEVTDYYASIETGNVEKTCGEVKALKERKEVVFENANEHDHGCSYTFKVENGTVAEVLDAIKELDPKDLSENVSTIKPVLDDYTSAEDILKKKLASVTETLENALKSYDEISAVATRTQNAEALARIIDSKVSLIERLSQEHLNINAQLEQLSRSKAQQLDRLDFTYFTVNVYENKLVDGEEIADSWKNAVRDAVRNANAVLQTLTVGLLVLLLGIAQYALYALLAIVVLKYVVKAGKWLWKR
jgi:chromosome segregation ATPase